MSDPCVVVAGGGTAGHVEPALAVADAVVRLAPDARVAALGTARGLETRLVPARGYPLHLVPPVPLPRRPDRALLSLPGRVRAAVAAAAAVLRELRADVVVGFGGYVSLPAYLAARRQGVPVVVHEANARAGLANRVGARGAAAVLVTVPGTRLPRAEVVGLPLRAAVAELDRPALRAPARAGFGLPPDGPVLLVTGGSQGAASVNRAVVAASAALRGHGVSLLHAAGAAHADAVAAEVARVRPVPATGGSARATAHVVVPYLERMDLAYAAADVAVCRAGAGTVAEASAVGLPAVYVPLPVGNGEQRRNAAPVVAAGGGVLVADADLDGRRLTDEVRGLLTPPERLLAASRAAATHGTRGADVVVARRVLAVAGHPVGGAPEVRR